MKALLSRGKTKLKSAYRKSASPNPSTTNVSANSQESGNHGQDSVVPERPLSCRENAAPGESLDVGHADSIGESVVLLETSDSSTAPHPADSNEESSENPVPSIQALPVSVAPPSADATVSSEFAMLDSSNAYSQGAYWYLAMKRLDESERNALKELNLTFDGDANGLGVAATAATKLPATKPSKPGFNDENASKLASLVSERINRLDDKAWRFRFRGRDIILRDLATKVATWLNKFKEIGDIVIQIDPIHAALPWAAIRFLLLAATAEQELAGHMLIGSEKVSYLLARCQIYKKLYLSEPEDAEYESAALLRKTLVDLYAAILRFLVYLMKLATNSSARRGLHATLNPNRLSERLSHLETLESKIETEASNCERETRALCDAAWNRKMDDMHNILSRHVLLSEEEREKHFEACALEERCAILQWISDIQYEADLYNARMGRTEGTGQWLLDDPVYHDWRTTSASICLWLHGIPGAGKTKLSTKVVDDLFSHISGQGSNEGLAFFFCDRNREKHKDPVWVLRTLLRQLAASLSDTTIVKCIRNTYIEAKGKGFASPITQEKCADLLLEMANIFPQITFVLDGLDECDKDTRSSLIDILDATMRKSGHPVKIFIASREHDDIALRYSSGDHLKVTAARNQSDIEKFVSDRMLSSRYCRTRMSETLREQVLAAFQTKSQGMFQWAALHIQELLKLERDSDVRKYLDELPVGIKAAYDKIYEKIQSERGAKSDVAIAAMKIMICAFRPLTPGELAIAACQVLGQEFNEDIDIGPLYLLEACHDLVEVFHSGAVSPRYVVAEEAQLLRRVMERDSFDEPEQHDRTYTPFQRASGVGSSRSSISSLGSHKLSQHVGDAETDERASYEVEDLVCCRFSHLSVTEYLLTQWDITELNAFAAKLCFHTLLRFSVPGAYDDQQRRPEPPELSDVDYVPLGKAYRYIEAFTRWMFSDVAASRKYNGSPKDFNYRRYLNEHHLAILEMPNASKYPSLGLVYNQAPVAWLRYCIETWYRHVKAVTDSPSTTTETKHSLNNLLHEFYGHPINGSYFWRAWVILFKLFERRTSELSPILIGFQRFMPAFWCAAVGDKDFLVRWIDEGLLDAHFASDGWDGSTRLGMELPEPDCRPDIFTDTFSLFTTALKNKNENICIELLIRGAGQSFNTQRESMVEAAIRSKKSNLVRQYVESGIDLKKEYYHGNLLHSAVHAGILEMVQLFVQGGADLSLRASGFHIPWSLTPLELACLLPIPEQISIYLVGLVSNITIDHPLAVSFAALTSKLEFLSVVASSGVDMDACVPDIKSEKPLPFRVGETPLLSVIRCTLYRSFRFIVNLDTRREALQILLKYGANPNVIGVDGLTPLQMAIYGENRDLSVPLILYGADLTVRDKSGTTVLQLVSRQGDLSLIRLLISQGVNVNEVSGVYRTALHAAFIKAIPPVILFDSRGSPIDPYKDFFEQSDGEEDFSWSADDERSKENDELSKEDDSRPADGNAVVKKGLDHVNSTSHPSHPEESISGDSLDSILRETLPESEYTAPNASWAFEPRAHWPQRRLRPSSLREQLRAGIKLPALFESDQRSAAFFVLVECGAMFDRGHYSGIDDDEIDMMELLFTACLEQLRSRSSDRGILGRFHKRSKYSWEDAERLFITRHDGYTMVKYLLNTEEGIFP